MEDIEDLFKKLMIPAMISLMAGLARFFFSDKRSIWGFLRGVFLASFFGFMTGLGLQDTGLSDGARYAIVGATSFCADEFAMLLVGAAQKIRKDPLGYLASVLDALRGK